MTRIYPANAKALPRWPLFLIAAPAAVAVWSGWVGLGALCGFGPVHLLPGISRLTINTAITLPVGVEAYGAYALGAWLAPAGSRLRPARSPAGPRSAPWCSAWPGQSSITCWRPLTRSGRRGRSWCSCPACRW